MGCERASHAWVVLQWFHSRRLVNNSLFSAAQANSFTQLHLFSLFQLPLTSMQGAPHDRPPLRPRPMSAKPSSSSSSSQLGFSLFSSARSLLQSQGGGSTFHMKNKSDDDDDDDGGVVDDDDDDEDSEDEDSDDNNDDYSEFGAAAEQERKSFQRQVKVSPPSTGTDLHHDSPALSTSLVLFLPFLTL